MRHKFYSYPLFALIIIMQVVHMGNAPIEEADLSKLHPKFRRLLDHDAPAVVLLKDGRNPVGTYIDNAGTVRYGVIIKSENMAELISAGIILESTYPGFATAKLSLEEMGRVARLTSVSYLDAPSINYPSLNVSTPATGAALIHSGFYNDTPYTGEGAIVVIYDSGIDFNHIDFKNPVDTTKSRILYIWDQTIDPVSGENNPAGFNYGVEYTQAQINDEIDGTPTGYIRHRDNDGHGTHVAGTAAGSGIT